MWCDQAKSVWSRSNSVFIFLTKCMHHFHTYILQKIPLKLVNWFQRYEQLKDAKNNRKQKTFSALFGSILKSIFPTSRLILLDHITYVTPGVNILPKEQIFPPMLPSCDHKVSPFLPQFCDYMRGSVAMKPLTAWGPGARLRAPGGVQGQSPWWGSRGQRPRKLQGFSQFNILRNSLQRALS